MFFRSGLTAAVFRDLGQTLDAIELLTICRTSLSTEVKIAFKKSDGIISREQVADFRCQTISFRNLKSTKSNCDMF